MGVGLMLVALLIAVMQGVFSKTWDVTLPQSITSMTNSCVTVPCHFEVPDDQEANLLNCSDRGLWRKGTLAGPIVLDSQNPFNNQVQGQVVGDLTKKNCTTVFSSFPKDYSDMYFFRLECLNTIKYTFSVGVMITFQPAPPPPTLTFVSQVSEGAQVRLQCSVPVPCSILPPSLTWLPRDTSRQEDTQMLQTADGHMMMTSTLTFVATADHQNQSIVCSVSYPLSKGGSTEPSAATQRLNILYAPRFTTATLSTSGPVSEGRTVIFTCSSDANPPVSRYSWHRDNRGILTRMGQGETLVLQVSQEDSGVYLCEAQNSRGSHRSRPLSLEVIATKGRSEDLMVVPYIICGVVLVLYILTVVVDLYKYQRRLKQIELKGEHTYSDLRTVSVTSDYDRLQFRQPKTKPPPEPSDYENGVTLQTVFKSLPPPNQT
ncbi:myelin-associated glycoprotein-like isoform X2 [Seriola dumerili]|uniref:myelin-associated glycoprotein-like isoform X2 n=1 Tax=Seriola dumerili TaxID=41447 RepID=UPI000BBF2644|nr:myelin-associated glycoprotein-like isoform X2 [Seriola dumerili]